MFFFLFQTKVEIKYNLKFRCFVQIRAKRNLETSFSDGFLSYSCDSLSTFMRCKIKNLMGELRLIFWNIFAVCLSCEFSASA